MADRVSVSIVIGGDIGDALIAPMVEVIENERLATEWDGDPFDAAQLPATGPLKLYAHEVANGELGELEAFCRTNRLSFRRWSGGSSGSFWPEIVVWTGEGDPKRYLADEDERAVISRDDTERLGSFEAILAYFDDADYAVPALRVR